MKEKIREIMDTLNQSIFVGDRYEKNLRNMAVTAVIVMIMGLVMTMLNIAQKQYLIAISPAVILVCGTAALIVIRRFRRRDIAVIITVIMVIFVLTFDVLFADNGFAYLWTMLVPLAVCYMLSVKTGFMLTAYFELLFIVVFYTPVRQFVAPRYTEIVMTRFPLLYFFHGLVVLYVMYQYHKSVLTEIEYTDRLSAEVARQTAVAEERSRRIEQMSLQTIQTLANAIDAKDPYTKGHSTRVSQHSVALAEALGWDRDRINDLRYSALLHDIGKIGVPDSILNNPKRLTDVEFEIIKSHTTMGADILRDKIMIKAAEDVARSHHERYDGKGYPRGLKGTEISEESRIVAIADAFDAMSTNRVYRKACDPAYIRKELQEGRGKQFDPQFAEVFITLWDQGKLDWILHNEEGVPDEQMEASSVLLREVMETFVSQSAGDNTDLVTGVMNRSAGEAAIAQDMKEDNGCFVFFDVDNLKKINDVHGHEAGDRTLKLMGETLTEHCGNNHCCRLGGDEFILFLQNTSREDAEKTVREIMQGFDEKKKQYPETIPASLSAGLAMCSTADTYNKAYNRADKALYHVKQNGKSGFEFYNSESDVEQGEEADIGRLIQGIKSSGSYEGAMDVEYRQFAKLYEYIVNLEKRFDQPFMLVMISLETLPGKAPHPDELAKAMYYMEQAIRQTIRNVDVLTQYSRHQFLIILVGTDPDGVRIAADRVFRGYFKMYGSGDFTPTYSVANVDRPAEPG